MKSKKQKTSKSLPSPIDVGGTKCTDSKEEEFHFNLSKSLPMISSTLQKLVKRPSSDSILSSSDSSHRESSELSLTVENVPRCLKSRDTDRKMRFEFQVHVRVKPIDENQDAASVNRIRSVLVESDSNLTLCTRPNTKIEHVNMFILSNLNSDLNCHGFSKEALCISFTSEKYTEKHVIKETFTKGRLRML